MQLVTDMVSTAARKMAAGALMNISEVGAILNLAPATVHALPLRSIRIGRSLRFDPADVRNFIDSCKEDSVSVEAHLG